MWKLEDTLARRRKFSDEKVYDFYSLTELYLWWSKWGRYDE
jgi:hypothetical protein